MLCHQVHSSLLRTTSVTWMQLKLEAAITPQAFLSTFRCALLWGLTRHLISFRFRLRNPAVLLQSIVAANHEHDYTIKMWNIGSSTPNYAMDAHDKGSYYIDFYPGADELYLVTTWRWQDHQSMRFKVSRLSMYSTWNIRGPPHSQKNQVSPIFWLVLVVLNFNFNAVSLLLPLLRSC